MARKTSRPIPAEVYLGFVRSLFHDSSVLLLAAFSHLLVGLLVYRKTGDVVYVGLTSLMILACLARYFATRRIEPLQVRTEEQARRLESYYIRWGALHSASVGIFSFHCLYLIPDMFAEIAAISMTLSMAITIAGRNFGSRRMVLILSLTALGPIAAGLMMKGDFYNIMLGLMIVPLIFTIDRMAGFTRDILFTAISEEQKARLLAQRFDRALNTMSHGLVMLDSSGLVTVANSQAASVLEFKSPDAILGRSLDSILLRGCAAGLIEREEYRRIVSLLGRALREGHDRKIVIRLNDGRYFEMSAREGHFDLGVITFEDVTQRVEAEERIRDMARFDQLTGLPNRAYFQELVQERLYDGDPTRLSGLTIIDLDDFKGVNDTLGHPVGDGLIYEIGQRLSKSMPGIEVCRFGGDEFVVFHNHIADEAHFARIHATLLEALQEEAEVAGHRFKITVSGGAALTRASEFKIDEMVVNADLALHVAKRNGKAQWQLFESSIDEAFKTKHRLVEELRMAIDSRSLNVVYQPIVDMKTMRIVGCEALCRWHHRELGIVAPAVFIPIAEEAGLVSEISTFVLETACSECANWPAPLTVSVNLSAKDFRSDDIIENVQAALDKAGLAPQRLEIEVTETALLDDKAATRRYLARLREAGIKVALDDFGTGYSTLSYLHQLPLDKIKIDRSFLGDLSRDARSLELLIGVTRLCHSIGASVTMEGVETFEQLTTLANSVRPDLVQGFLFGSALTGSGIRAMAATVFPFPPPQTQTLPDTSARLSAIN